MKDNLCIIFASSSFSLFLSLLQCCIELCFLISFFFFLFSLLFRNQFLNSNWYNQKQHYYIPIFFIITLYYGLVCFFKTRVPVDSFYYYTKLRYGDRKGQYLTDSYLYYIIPTQVFMFS